MPPVTAPVRSAVVALDPRTPVLVGVGQVNEAPGDAPLTERPEPVDLMARAVREAAADCGATGSRLLRGADSVRIMVPLSWGYTNPGLLVAERLGLSPAESALSVIGGNGPQTVVNLTAQDIAAGRLDVAVLAGAESLYTRLAARRRPDRPHLPWTIQPPHTEAPVVLGVDRRPVTETELARGLDRPIHVYPLFENALRAWHGESIAEHQATVAGLWARFSAVASHNPHAWTTVARHAEEIARVGPQNRMVSFPYPKLMNANDRVDQGAALILCSVAAARAAGVAEEKWVFPLSGSDAHDHWFVSERSDLRSSPAIRHAGAAALAGAGVGIDDVAHVDLYSCFPCAVQIAAGELGLPFDDVARPLTVTGGLAFAGGPGNNYVTHSIATMAERLREDPGAVGLVTGVGWYLTKHAVGLWSTTPPPDGFVYSSPQDEVDALPRRREVCDFEGDAEVESYTVVHDHDGRPEKGVLSLLTGDGGRTWGTVDEPELLGELEREEGCGRRARVGADGRVELTG